MGVPPWRGSCRRGDLVVDDLLELLVRLRALDVAAVEVEVRRPLHADLRAERQVGVDAALAGAAVERGLELAHVEAELPRVLLEVGALDVLLVGEQLVVHLPELALRLGRQRGLGGQRRVGVERQRVVAEEEPDLVRVLLLDLVHRRNHAAAERTLEVGERDDVDLGRGRSARRPFQRDPESLDPVGRFLAGFFSGFRCCRGVRRRRFLTVVLVLVAHGQSAEAVAASCQHDRCNDECSLVHDLSPLTWGRKNRNLRAVTTRWPHGPICTSLGSRLDPRRSLRRVQLP